MGSVKATIYGILREPKLTEKTASVGSKSNTVVFEVHPKANKNEIKNAVEKLFDVKVESVRTINSLGKVRRVRAAAGRQRSSKKAYIKLRQGSTIDIIEGL